MSNFLNEVVVILAMIVVLGFFNEKVTKLTYEIALMLFSICIGGILLVVTACLTSNQVALSDLFTDIQVFNLNDYLMTKGILCFMLFAGSCHMRLLDFKKHARSIGLLSMGATLLGAVFYGVLFYGAAQLLGLGLSFPVCLMFGSITAPTDPIAATSILKKFNLPPNINFIIEGESLLNDGVGVALFVCFSGLVTADNEGGGFFAVLGRELFGAILVGIVITLICFPVFKRTVDSGRRIFVSLLAVSLTYLLCEWLEFSGATASVVCGVLFSALRNREEARGNHMELKQYDEFWEIVDNLLNSILYVMLGFAFFNILKMPEVLLISGVAVVANLLGRSGSVGVATLFMGELPDGYNRAGFIQLLTWGGLRGGLSVALAMSTRTMLPDNVYYIVLGGTFAIVFFTTVIQGLTIPKLYRRIEKKIDMRR